MKLLGNTSAWVWLLFILIWFGACVLPRAMTTSTTARRTTVCMPALSLDRLLRASHHDQVDNGNIVPSISSSGPTQGYKLNSFLAHLVICVVDIWLGSATTWFDSRFTYAMMNCSCSYMSCAMWCLNSRLKHCCKMNKHSGKKISTYRMQTHSFIAPHSHLLEAHTNISKPGT